jgi:aspartate aminotransferase
VKPAPLRLSPRARQIEVSPTVAVAQRASALRGQGERILDFSVGEPDQSTAKHITAAATAALEAGKTRYTPSAGLIELRAAVAARYLEDDGIEFATEEVAITNGGKQALYVVCQALFDRGDEVLVPTPHWPTFEEAPRRAGARAVLRPLAEKDGFRIRARAIAKAIGPRTRAIVVNTPSNPTGAVIDPAELLAIGKLAKARGVTILYDDTYARLTYDAVKKGLLAELRAIAGDRLVILGTASKTYCMTGWRIGWVLGGKTLVEACSALLSHSTQCPATFSQHAAVCALTGPQESVEQMQAEYRRRRDYVYPAVAAIPRVTCASPGGGFYVFPNVSAFLGGKHRDTMTLARTLLEHERVAVVPGEGFGAPGYLRLSFARPMRELQDGVARLAAFLQGLRT